MINKNVIIVKGTFSIECKKCLNIEYFPANNADFNLTGTGEWEKGRVNWYCWISNYTCKCKKEIDFEYEVYEYPVGVVESTGINVNNGFWIHGFDFDFHGEPEPDDNKCM